MGLFKKKAEEVSFSIEMGTDDEYQKLLKEATQKKQNGNYDKAIELLKSIFEKIKDKGMMVPIATYLRLPLYLQQAGRKDEAWKEFNNLILWVNSKPRYSSEVTPMEQSIIWDKMRLFLQREGKYDNAVTFGIWSYLSWCAGLYAQERNDEFKACLDQESIKKSLVPLLQKADKEKQMDEFVDMVASSLRRLPNLDYKKVATEIQAGMKVT